MQNQEIKVDEFNEWLTEHSWELPQCPVSKTSNWQLAPNLVEFRQYHGGSMVVIGTKVYPAAMVICTDCGYTMFFNAVVAGFTEEG